MLDDIECNRQYYYTELSNIVADLANKLSIHLQSNIHQQDNLPERLVLKFVRDAFSNKQDLDLTSFDNKRLIPRLTFAQHHFFDVGTKNPHLKFGRYQAIALLSSCMTDLWNKKISPKDDQNIFSKYLKSEKDEYPIFCKLCERYKIDRNNFFS